MSKNKRFALQAVAFCLIFAALFFPVQEVLVRKSLAQPWDMTNKISGFYNEPENEFSVIYFGSSHAYASFSPLDIWKETGVKSYVFATQMQPMWASVTYLKEALKTQKPSLVVLECNMLYEDSDYMDDGTTHSYMDDLPLSAAKAALAQVSAPEGKRLPLVLPFVKYHSRWSSLTRADFTFRRNAVRDPYKGFVLLPHKTTDKPILRLYYDPDAEPLPLSAKNEQYLREFIEICAENDIDLWLVKAPCNISAKNYRKMLAAAAIGAEYGVPFDDFNSTAVYDAVGIAAGENFFDQRHMDITGSRRFSRYFAALLTERYPNLPRDYENDEWARDFESYNAETRVER